MSKISEKLARKPHDTLESDHNGQIKAFLIELGVDSRFTKTPTGAKETVQCIVFNEHPTHWILFQLYLGYERDKDNGYLMRCVPKSKYSYEHFQQFAKAVMNPTDERMIGGDVFWAKPGNPSN